jgi:hypothetical protein
MRVMLTLPNVSLIIIDTHCADLARLAVFDSIRHIKFADLLIFSSDCLFFGQSCRNVRIPRFESNEEFTRFLWLAVPNHLATDYMLIIQWDSWILDPGMWTGEFLNYDYIGAPWSYNDGLNVGNGCGLRSRQLMRFLQAKTAEFPVPHDKEDDVLCRHYRPRLESHGFKWAPEQLASRLSFEGSRPAPDSRHFMFHDSFNFSSVLDGERLAQRMRLMQANAHLRVKGKLDPGRLAQRATVLPRLAMENAP